MGMQAVGTYQVPGEFRIIPAADVNDDAGRGEPVKKHIIRLEEFYPAPVHEGGGAQALPNPD
jgi:hypothetical protein